MPKHIFPTRRLLVPWLSLLPILWAPTFAQRSLSPGPTTLIYPESNPISDAVAATLTRSSTTMWLWRSTWNRTVKYYGTANSPQQYTVSDQQNKNIFTIPTALQKSMRVSYEGIQPVTAIPAYRYVNFYLKNVIDLGNNQLLGLLHLEYLAWNKQLNTNNQWTGLYIPGYDPVLQGASYYSIGMAFSTNTGDSWKFLGDIIRTNDKTPNLLSANVGGAAYLRVGSYIYVYFNEKKSGNGAVYPAVARALLSNIAGAAGSGTTTPWKKYNALTKAFDQDGVTGLGSEIIAGGGLDMHTDAAYCTPLKKYLIAVSDGTTQTLKILRSSDGINWVSPTFLASSYTAPDGKLHLPCYPYFYSLDGDANSDNSVVGKNFNVFYVSQYFPPNGVQWFFTDEPIYRVQYKLITDMLPITNLLN
jgi:hypothetical protein